jgi:guanylate kinase
VMISEKWPVYVVSAPSGAGKTTLNSRLVREHSDIEISISLTTRPVRPGEVNGQDYHFVTREEFQSRVSAGDMLEWAEVFGNLYGTTLSEIERIGKAGHKAILEIDVQGWQKARRKLRSATSIFILPPTLETLWKRLEMRGTDSLDVRWRRLVAARDEIASGRNYDWFIINDQFDRAYHELEDIVWRDQPGLMDGTQGHVLCRKLLDEFERSDWLKDLRSKFAGSW